MQEILTAIGPYITTLLIAAIGFVITYINYRKKAIEMKEVKEKINTLDEFLSSDDTEYYVTCPNCGHEICLNKLKIIARKGGEKNVDK